MGKKLQWMAQVNCGQCGNRVSRSIPLLYVEVSKEGEKVRHGMMCSQRTKELTVSNSWKGWGKNWYGNPTPGKMRNATMCSVKCVQKRTLKTNVNANRKVSTLKLSVTNVRKNVKAQSTWGNHQDLLRGERKNTMTD